MKIVKISVHAGHTFNDPFEQFANHRIGLALEAEIGEGERVDDAISQLQAHANDRVMKRRAEILDYARSRLEAGEKRRSEINAYGEDLKEAYWRLRDTDPEHAKALARDLASDDIPF